MQMKIDKNPETNQGQVKVGHEEWVKQYNDYYEVIFTRMTADAKMKGFRGGKIPGILLELKYPYIVEETNQQSILAIIQNIYENLTTEFKKVKIVKYEILNDTKDFILDFEIVNETDNKEDKKDIPESTNETKTTSKKTTTKTKTNIDSKTKNKKTTAPKKK